MKTNQTSFWYIVFTLAIQLAACGEPAHAPIITTITSTTTPSPTLSITPSPTPSITPTITFTPTPDSCNSAQWQERIQVISQDLFTALGPGPTVYDRILIEQNQAWADFRQYDRDEIRSAGVIFHEIAFGPPSPELGEGVSPAVLLVTYGVDKNWELPADGNLVSEVDYIRAVLHQRENYWILETTDRSQSPMITNAATYALYHYFGDDLSKLEDWCRTYVQMFGESR
jgi:hypothetical protein